MLSLGNIDCEQSSSADKKLYVQAGEVVPKLVWEGFW